MNKILFISFLFLLYQIEVHANECNDALESNRKEVQSQRSLAKFKTIHSKFVRNALGDFEQIYTPAESNLKLEMMNLEKSRKAVSEELEIIDRSALNNSHPRTQFDFKLSSSGPPIAGKYYKGLSGEVRQFEEFKNLNHSLGSSGAWFIFRAYSWAHLGFKQFAGPHMSIVIGDRVYEVGRHLKYENSEAMLTIDGRPGPISMTIDEFLLKSKLENAQFDTRSGFFFAERYAGIDKSDLQSLAEFFESEADKFNKGKKFNYVMDPNQDPEGQNCVSFLMEPFKNKNLVGGIELMNSFGLRRNIASPIAMLFEGAGFGMAKLVKPILFVESEIWRHEIDQRLSKTQLQSQKDNSDNSLLLPELKEHPQLTAFLFDRFRFRFEKNP